MARDAKGSVARQADYDAGSGPEDGEDPASGCPQQAADEAPADDSSEANGVGAGDADLPVNRASSLELPPKEAAGSEPHTVTILFQGKASTVTVGQLASVLELKEKLAEMTGVPADKQKLLAKGRMLGDAEEIGDCVEDGDKIRLMGRPSQ